MMGGSGGGGFKRYPASQMRKWLDDAAKQIDRSEHNARVAATLGDLLAQYNDRDEPLVRQRLQDLRRAIQDATDTSLDLVFGGSIAKHTYVDGLSDIDVLAILQDPAMAALEPRRVLAAFRRILESNLPWDADISVGNLALTIHFGDGMELQVLPAIRTSDGVKIATAQGDNWSHVVRPEMFARKLTERNRECNGQLIPVIKLAKGALAELPESIRPIGYHMESLALDVFKAYQGPMTTKAMLQRFFEGSSSRVLTPIRDATGQSLNVDDYLGAPNSPARVRLAGILNRMARRMDAADRMGDSEQWLAAIGSSP